jgi:hypothetical protein
MPPEFFQTNGFPMSNERTAIKPNHDLPAKAGRVNRDFETAVQSENASGGEVRPEQYKTSPKGPRTSGYIFGGQ